MAFYRLLFHSRSTSEHMPKNIVEHTSFTVRADVEHMLDLTAPPYDTWRDDWTNPGDYTACQDFAARARRIELQMIRYKSVRDPSRRHNVAVLDPAALDGESLEISRSWHFRFERGRLTTYAAFPSPGRLTFTFEQFGLAPVA